VKQSDKYNFLIVNTYQMADKNSNILYIDDEVHNLTAFKANFRKHYNIFIAESAEEGKKILKENKIHVIISDQRMPNMTGVEFLASILKEFPDPIRILLTGYTDIETVIEAINKGHVYKYITKPFVEAELKITIDNALEVYFLREQNKALMEQVLLINEQLEFMLRQRLLS
jgi:response regulator RpfG family c-di-GMP phosphodiesterase